MKFIKIVSLVLLFSVILSQTCFGSEEVFRRVKAIQIIPSPPGVKGEVLLRNLYALLVIYGRALNWDISVLVGLYPALSYIYDSNLAKEPLSEDKLSRLIEEMSKISKKELEFRYALYTELYNSPAGENNFGNLLNLFQLHFLHVLNVSGTTEPVFKLVHCIVAAEAIAGQSRHELENSEWTEKCIEWHKALLINDDSYLRNPDSYPRRGPWLKKYGWDKLEDKDREIVMACVYIILINKGVENTSYLLSTLSRDPETQVSLVRVREVIQHMYLTPELKAKVLSQFPQFPKEE